MAREGNSIGAVLIVGGGIGGIQAALDLAESGYKVYLVEKSPAIGGVMAQLDKTFPTNDCSICILSPKLVECGRHPNIELLSYSELLGVEGKPGDFKAVILKHARYVNESLCTGCGVCQEKCPWSTDSEFDQGLGRRKAIYVPYAQAIPNIPVIDRELCAYFRKGTCRACEKFCPTGAIEFNQIDQKIELSVGAVILSLGFDEFDPTPLFNYGYKKYPNVVTSIEFERMLSASGPYRGELLRPSDKKPPRRIAWIQCIGSRDNKHPYCSSVCCTYAIKEAIVAKEHVPSDLEETIFFMDMRTQGKDFDKFYERAKREGIDFVRTKVYQVQEVDGTGNLLIKYLGEDDKPSTCEFDLVVLSVGLQPSLGNVALAKKLGVQLDPYGFCHTQMFSPVETSRPGIFVCGAFQGPKDIPETVMQASSSAAKSASLLSQARNTLTTKKKCPQEKDVSEEEPRIGVFICHCGINIGGVVNVPEVAEYAKTLPNVVYAENNLYTCSQDTQERIKAMVKEHNLNRVVVAACSPRTHEPLFQETIREAGLNKYLFEMANIRDQCSWVHRDHPEEATQKARELVKGAVAKARLIQPLKELTIPVIAKGLIIGGGIAGMTTALELANQGFESFLIEKSDKLGGNAWRVHYTLDGKDIPELLNEMIEKVGQNELIHLYKNTEIKEVSGYIGNFKTRVSIEGEEKILEHGVIIVATGGSEYQPSQYLYGENERVITQLELEEKLATGALKAGMFNNVVMIQCVGSRTEERPYCSKVCCSQAVKNALKIKEINPSANIYIYYKDMRTYGVKEELYRRARNLGVTFIRYTDENKPEVTGDSERIEVKAFDSVLNEDLLIKPDLVILSAGIVPNKDSEALAKMLKVPLNQDGFFLEAHVKLRPVDFATDGIFVAGLAHSPKPIEESISQALAAAGKAAIPLSKGLVSAEPIVSSVNDAKCFGCGLCELICPFAAIRLVPRDGVNKAETIPASCKGCGLCAASCPKQAISMGHFRSEELTAQVEALVSA
jgi:heterodisulfide reductase subunit A